MITEAEAKTKWCPYMRGPHGSNMVGLPPEQKVVGVCVGSACMAFRVGDEGTEFVSDGQTSPHRVDKDTPPSGEDWKRHSNGYMEIGWIRQVREPRGYCGAFGEPK